MITFEKKEEAAPICPHCKKELAKVWFQQLKGAWASVASTFARSVNPVLVFPTEKESLHLVCELLVSAQRTCYDTAVDSFIITLERKVD